MKTKTQQSQYTLGEQNVNKIQCRIQRTGPAYPAYKVQNPMVYSSIAPAVR